MPEDLPPQRDPTDPPKPPQTPSEPEEQPLEEPQKLDKEYSPESTAQSEAAERARQAGEQALAGAKVAGERALTFGQKFTREGLLGARRVFKSDFQIERATDEEREKLASGANPISSELAQDYAGWRKSILFLASFFLLVHAVLAVYNADERSMEDIVREQAKQQAEEMIAQQGAAIDKDTVRQQIREQWQMQGMDPRWDQEAFDDEVSRQYKAAKEQLEGLADKNADEAVKNVGKENLEFIDGLNVGLSYAVFAGALMVMWGARKWSDVRASRTWSRLGWIVMFATPLLITALPLTLFMDFSHIDDENQRETMRQGFGAGFALSVFMLVGPKVIALFPGIIRSSMSLKTLLPQSAAPGWYAALLAPLYAVFLIMVTSAVTQAYGDLKLVGALVCFVLGALVFVLKAKELTKAHSPDEVSSVVGGVRKLSGAFATVGVVLLGWFVLDMPDLTVLDGLNFVIGLFGSVLLLTIVASDFILSLLHQSFAQAKSLAGTDYEDQLESRYEELAAVGFTEMALGRKQLEASSESTTSES